MMKSIPRIGLGTFCMRDGVEKIVYEAAKAGYKHFDCAMIYKNQKEIGIGLKKAFDEQIVKREDIWITSKLWNDMHSKSDVKKACLQTLADLNLHYIDLFLIHWPIATDHTGQKLVKIPLAETWKAMEGLVDEGLVRHIGVSNFDLQLLYDLLSYCRIKPLTNQVECHVYLPQLKLLDFCQREDIYLTAYSPLVRGSHSKSHVPQPFEDQNLVAIAKEHNKTVPQVLLQWQLQRSKHVVIIPKTSTISRLPENLHFDFHLTEKNMQDIAKLNGGCRLISCPGPIEVFN